MKKLTDFYKQLGRIEDDPLLNQAASDMAEQLAKKHTEVLYKGLDNILGKDSYTLEDLRGRILISHTDDKCKWALDGEAFVEFFPKVVDMAEDKIKVRQSYRYLGKAAQGGES